MKVSRVALPFLLAAGLSGCDFPLFSGGGSSDIPMLDKAIVDDSAGPITPVDYAKFIFIGDSLLDDWNPWTPFNLMTSELIENEEQRPVLNIALGGQRLHSAVSDNVAGAINFYTGHGSHSPMAVFVELAHNDWAFAKYTLDEYYDNYVTLLSSIEDRNDVIDLYCIVPIVARHDYEHPVNPHGETYDDVRETVRRVADTGLCELIETASWYDEGDIYDTLLFPDGLHMGPGAHRKYKDGLMIALGRPVFFGGGRPKDNGPIPL